MALFRNAGLGELRTLEVDNIEAAKRMVEHRLGVAFLPRTAIVRSVSAGNLALISIRENPGMTRTIVALKRRDAATSGAVPAVLEAASHPGGPHDPGPLSPPLATPVRKLHPIDLFYLGARC